MPSTQVTIYAALQRGKPTKTGLDDLYGAVVVLDGLAVLIHVAQCGGNVIVGLCQQTTVGRKVLQLQGKTLLEVFQRLGIVTWRTEQVGLNTTFEECWGPQVPRK